MDKLVKKAMENKNKEDTTIELQENQENQENQEKENQESQPQEPSSPSSNDSPLIESIKVKEKTVENTDTVQVQVKAKKGDEELTFIQIWKKKTHKQRTASVFEYFCLYGIPIICAILLIAASTQTSSIIIEGTVDLEFSNDSEVTASELKARPFRIRAVELDKPHLSDGWRLVLSLIPLVIVFLGILGYQLSSKIVSSFGVLVVILIGTHWFTDSSKFLYDDLPTMMGKIFLTIIDRLLWTIFDYALNMFSALFFLEVCKNWGIIEQIRIEFSRITDRPNRLILAVWFCFGMLLAVVAPGGSNYLIAGAILIKMNLKPTILEEDKQRILLEYDERHEGCKVEDCLCKNNPTEEQKLEVDNNNRIGEICQFGNALASAFNLLGVCVIATASLIIPYDSRYDTIPESDLQSIAEKEIGRTFSLLIFVLAAVSPFFMNIIYSRRRWLWQRAFMDPNLSKMDYLMLGIVGLVFAFFQWIVAGYIGPELPCLIAGLLCLIVYISLEKYKDIYQRKWPGGRLKDRKYLIPFILLFVVLLVIRLIPGVEYGLTGEWDKTASRVLAPKIALGGYSKVDFPWVVHSGVIVSIIALLTPIMVPYYQPDRNLGIQFPVQKDGKSIAKSMLRAQYVGLAITAFKRSIYKRRNKEAERKKIAPVLKESFMEAFHEIISVLVTISAFSTLARLMADFEMTQTIALAIVRALSGAPPVFALFIPLIGMLGSGLTGSTTTSNLLFAILQVKTATTLNLIRPGMNSIYEIVGAQMLGSTAGEIISPMNAVVITLMAGIDKKEPALIKGIMPIALMWLVGAMVLSLIFIATPGGFID